METIRIHENNYDIVLYLDKDKFFGYKFNNDNTVEKINKNVFKYFDFLTCSSNYTVLADENDYKVVLDNETNFKHYFKGGSEDYAMFFLNNGKEVISYKQHNSVQDIIRNISMSFIVGSTTICLSLGAYHLIELHTNNNVNNYVSNVQENKEFISEEQTSVNEQQEDRIIASVISNDITYEDVVSMINNSPNLNKEEKEFFINEDLINDVLETVNKSNVTKYDLMHSLKDVDIESYTQGDKGVDGYYKPSTPNKIYVRNYDGLTSKTKETISHEEIHFFQYHYLDYELLKEAAAEIISDEYYEDSTINAYPDQVYLTKKLMEIIGSEPVWYYTFTGDFSHIEKEVRPYLDNNQYKMFLEGLKYDYDDSKGNLSNFDKLNSILDILYKNKYNKDVSQDEVIPLLGNFDATLKRYYFNDRKMNKENSYYEDGNNITSMSMTLNEAVLKNYIVVEEEIKEFITSDKVYDYLKSHDNKGLIRHCTYCKDFVETSSGFTNGGVKISGYIGDKQFDNVSEEELIEKGIILNCEYYYIRDRKKLSPKDFFDGKYDPKSKLNYLPNQDKCYFCTFNGEGDMEIYFSSKTYLPTIDEKFANSKVR